MAASKREEPCSFKRQFRVIKQRGCTSGMRKIENEGGVPKVGLVEVRARVRPLTKTGDF